MQNIDATGKMATDREDAIWEKAKDFSALCALNKEYLQGKISKTPYHMGPIEKETIPLVPGLLRLHEFGLLTVDSQPYEHDAPFQLGAQWAEYRQRPYVSFVAQCGEAVSRFYEQLKEEPDLVVYAAEIFPYKLLEGTAKEAHIVTQERFAKTLPSMKSVEWRTLTTVRTCPDMAEEDFFHLHAIQRAGPVAFEIAAREWAPVDLLSVVERIARECKLSV